MEMHQLRYFVAVAETGSFSRAAERCYVAQPSLSQQVRKLEQQLGQRLFDRLPRRVVLTGAGQLLLDRARGILAAVDDAERQLRDADPHGHGRLTVGAIPTIAPYLLPPALEQFLGRYPAIELTVHEDLTRHLVAATVAGDLDLALVALPIHDERLDVEPLLTEPLVLALPRGHRLARRRRIGHADLRAERFILLHEIHCLGEQVLSFCRQHGLHLNVACRSAQLATVQALVALGQGVSLVPAMAQHADSGDQRVYRALSGAPLTRTIATIRHRHRYHGPATEAFLAQLRRLAAP